MSACLPAVTSERYITHRRVRRCFADGRGVVVVIETGEAFVIGDAVVRLLAHALDVRDGRRREQDDRRIQELAILAAGQPPAAPLGPEIPTWFVVALILVVAGYFAFFTGIVPWPW